MSRIIVSESDRFTRKNFSLVGHMIVLSFNLVQAYYSGIEKILVLIKILLETNWNSRNVPF